MKVKKIPMRTCIVTKEKCEKKDLIRIVRTPLREVVIDKSGKLNGRGAYIKLNEEVIKYLWRIVENVRKIRKDGLIWLLKNMQLVLTFRLQKY